MRDRAAARGVPGRVVACSSIANMLPGALDVDDLDWRKRESPIREVVRLARPGSGKARTAEKRDPEAERATPQGRAMSKMGIRRRGRGRRWEDARAATAADAGRVSGRFFVDPGLEYPGGATREQLVRAQDWFLVSPTDLLARQLHPPDQVSEWRTAENARKAVDALGGRGRTRSRWPADACVLSFVYVRL